MFINISPSILELLIDLFFTRIIHLFLTEYWQKNAIFMTCYDTEDCSRSFLRISLSSFETPTERCEKDEQLLSIPGCDRRLQAKNPFDGPFPASITII